MPEPEAPFDTEREVIRRCLAGDPGAWGAFVRRYEPPLSGAIARTLRTYGVAPDPARIDDLLQETFVALLRDRSAILRRLFSQEPPFIPYLAAIAVHRSIDWLRRSRAFPSLEEAEGPAALWKGLLADDTVDPSARLQQEESRLQLESALNRLPVSERLALRLYYGRSWPASAIARALRIRPDSVWVYLGRARQRLRALLKGFPVL